MHGYFCSKFLRKEWRVLLCTDVKTSCQHEWSCSCHWCKAIKHHGNSPLIIQIDDKNWVGEESSDVVAKKFHSSPVALILPHGYEWRDNHSKEAMEWILWFQHTYHENVVMRHARSADGEKHIWYDVKAGQLFYAVDGYFVDNKGVEHVLEFNSCWYHGCPRCYPRDRDTLMINTKSLKLRYLETLKKEKTLTSIGYVVHSMWSCDFLGQKSITPPFQDFCSHLDVSETMNIRDSYFGGHTNGIQLYKLVDDKE